MTDDEKLSIHSAVTEAVKSGIQHSKPSPETDRRVSILETNFSNINEDLKDIKTAITRSTIWLITTLFAILISSFSLAFWLGTWKGAIEERLNTIQKEHDKTVIDLQETKNNMRGVAKEEVDNFAKKNLDFYYK